MNTEAALGHTFARLMDGSPSEQVILELDGMGTSRETAQEIVSRAATMMADAHVRGIAASLGRYGRSSAEIWEALVSRGVERGTAEAFVKDLAERRRRIEAEEDMREDVRTRRRAGQRQFWVGVAALLTAALQVAVSLLVGVWLTGLLTVGLVIGGIVYIGRGSARLQEADGLEAQFYGTWRRGEARGGA